MSKIVDSSLMSAAKGTALFLFGAAASMLMWFAIKVLIARSTTKEELGIYSIAIAVASIATLVGSMGLPEGVARYISLALGEGKDDRARAIAAASSRLGTFSGLAMFALLYIFSGPLSKYVFYKPELEAPLKVFAFYMPFAVMTQLYGSVLRGYNHIKPTVYYLSIGQPLFFLTMLGAVVILGLPFISIIIAFAIAMALVFAGMGIHGYRKAGLGPLPQRAGAGEGPLRRELIRFSFPLLAAGVMSVVLTWTDTLMLGRYSGAEAVGVYNVSISLAKLLGFSLSALGFVFMPLAGEMHSRGQSQELGRTYQVLTKWVFSATLPVFFVLFFFPEMTISFLFGSGFLGASLPLRILSLGFLFSVFLGVNGLLMVVFGMSKELMKVSVLGTLLNIVLNYILIKRLGLGISGAAASTCASIVVINVMISSYVYKASRIHPFTAKYLKPTAASALVALAVYGLSKTVPVFHLWLMPVYLLLFVGGYVFSLLASRSIDREDIAMLDAVALKTGVEMKGLRDFVSRFAR